MQRRKRYLLCLSSALRILSPVKCRSPENFRKLNHGVGDNNSAYLLEIRNLGGKYLRNLGDYFLDKKPIFHPLSSLHDTVELSINLTGLRMILTYCTMAASMTYFLSSLTFFTTSLDSTIVSSLIRKLRLTKKGR